MRLASLCQVWFSVSRSGDYSESQGWGASLFYIRNEMGKELRRGPQGGLELVHMAIHLLYLEKVPAHGTWVL